MPYLTIPPPQDCNCQTLKVSKTEATSADEEACHDIRNENMARIVEHTHAEIRRLRRLISELNGEGEQQRSLENEYKLSHCSEEANERFHHELMSFREHWPNATKQPNGGLDFDEDIVEEQSYFPWCRTLADIALFGDRSSSDD